MKTDTVLNIIAAILLVPALLFEIWVLTILWDWFVANPFGVRSLTMPIAFGLMLIAHIGLRRPGKRDDKGALEQVLEALVRAAFVLAFGFITTLFM